MNALEYTNKLHDSLITVIDTLICKGIEMADIALQMESMKLSVSISSWTVCYICDPREYNMELYTDWILVPEWSSDKEWVGKQMIDWVVWVTSPGQRLAGYR